MPCTTDMLLNDFAIRCFRNTADRDYVHARLAFRAKIIPQFLWSSLHCLEKYGKCILLLNRIEAKSIKHEIHTSLERMNTSGKFTIELSEDTEKFIERLESGAKFRYLESSWYHVDYDLIRLDKAVSEIRRYCQILDDDIDTEDGKTILLQHNLETIKTAREKNRRNTCIQHGWLEEVINDRKHPARSALVWNNLFFGTSRRKVVKVRLFIQAENAPLYLHPEIIDEVCLYVHLPKDVITAYKNI